MRPLGRYDFSSAFTPSVVARVISPVSKLNFLDSVLSSRPKVLGRTKNGGSPNGTFLNIGATKYTPNRFAKSRPLPAVVLRPIMPKANKQVTSSATLNKKPGYSNNLPMGPNGLSDAINKKYYGSPYMP